MRLTKHHGLGNDFLVLLDTDGSQDVTPATARSLCDRRMGVGADGLLVATPPAAGSDAVATMVLLNADGSRAEMSGNGIRCLAQALLMAGWASGPDVPIDTDAGRRTVTAHEPIGGPVQESSVAMGAARLLGDAPEWAGGAVSAAMLVDMGNPHLVLRLASGEGDAARLDTPAVSLVEVGERANAKIPGGANVHLLTGGPDGISIRTYERGVGPTLACGTGACASAAAAQAWGLAGVKAVVHMPGGAATVTLGKNVTLRGPAAFVATVEVGSSPR
jgi:diaminopimelate epimerase